MGGKEKSPFPWLPLLFAGVGAFVLPLLIELSSVFDFGEIFYFFLVAPLVAIALTIVAAHRRTVTFWSLVVVYCAISYCCWRNAFTIRTMGRWLLESKSLQAEVLAQPNSATGEFKHIEWDGWGFAGAGDTNVYLVFDPRDSLKGASATKAPGKYAGLPCEVSRVRRLESHWYSVTFFTDTGWNYCG